MKSFDITIYGHLTYDNIYDGFSYKASVGSMGNVWSQLKTINPNLKVQLEPTDIGESLIMVNREQCKRTSISRLSLKTGSPTIHDSKINHIMYFNELSDTSFITDIKGFIVADVCNGKPLNFKDENLQHIDLLLMACEDFNEGDIEITDVVRGTVVLHYPKGSTILAGKTRKEYSYQHAELVPNVNVLGAGDKLAAYILAGLLENTQDLPKVIQDAHNALTKYYKDEKI